MERPGGLAAALASSSSRGTWIEIFSIGLFSVALPVVLLAEDVDRNDNVAQTITVVIPVVLLAEDVDRNTIRRYNKCISPRRPPRGGRG